MTSSFKEKVYKLVRAIPKSKVATYGQLAKLAGKAKAARVIGMFMRINRDIPNTPCHRVVATDGSLTGYSGHGGVADKKKMLLKEGVHFKGDLVDLSRSQWKRL